MIAALQFEATSAAVVRGHLTVLSELAQEPDAAAALERQGATTAAAAALLRHGASVGRAASALVALLSTAVTDGDEETKGDSKEEV